MDLWQKMKNEIDKRYKNIGQQTDWSPFVTGNNVVAAVEDVNGKIWTGSKYRNRQWCCLRLRRKSCTFKNGY